MQKIAAILKVKPLSWYFAGLIVAMLTGMAIGRLWLGRSAEAGATRVDAYARCTALIDKGAQWEESEDSWRCKVAPEIAR